MIQRTIPASDHVARYCKPSSIVERAPAMVDEVLPTAFEFKQDLNGWEVSVNWMELLSPDHALAMPQIRAAVGAKLTLRPKGRFAVLNAGRIRAMDLVGGGHPDVVHRPAPNDYSHAGIFVVADPLQVAADLAALVRSEGVLYPAVV